MLPEPVDYQIYRGEVRLNPAKSFTYWLAGNGVFKMAQGQRLTACVQVASGRIAGLPALSAGARVQGGLLPERFLELMWEHARRLAWDAPREALFLVECEGRERRLLYPSQTGSAASLRYVGAPSLNTVLELHSHHAMGAFFSSTDNADEQGLRLYAVIGKIFTRPEIALRVGVYGDFARVSVKSVFEGLGPFREVL